MSSFPWLPDSRGQPQTVWPTVYEDEIAEVRPRARPRIRGSAGLVPQMPTQKERRKLSHKMIAALRGEKIRRQDEDGYVRLRTFAHYLRAAENDILAVVAEQSRDDGMFYFERVPDRRRDLDQGGEIWIRAIESRRAAASTWNMLLWRHSGYVDLEQIAVAIVLDTLTLNMLLWPTFWVRRFRTYCCS